MPLSNVDALRTSVERLRSIVEPLDDHALASPAYPSEWTIAQVLSHLGSAAVIMRRRLDDTLAGQATPDDVVPPIWDQWNAKSPRAQADDALEADADLLQRYESVAPEDRDRFVMSMGPLQVDFEGCVGLRLNEHALHTWDVEVALDATATIPTSIAEVVVDQLQIITRYTAKPDSPPTTVAIQTSEPARRYTLAIDADAVTLEPGGDGSDGTELHLPAEALIRLVYGRLDAAHTPSEAADDPTLERLRRVFPGP